MSKKYGRTYHLPWSPGTTSDDRISKDVSSLLNREIVITEKLDGENCGMTKDGVYARSHIDFTISPWSREVRSMHGLIGRYLPENFTIFGENMEGIHSIEYDSLSSYFYMFGVREDETSWLSWDGVEETAFLLDLPTVPVLFRGIVKDKKELQEIVEDLVSKKSRFGQKIEGCVVRVAESFADKDFATSVMKWVRKGHVATDEHWIRNWKKASIIR